MKYEAKELAKFVDEGKAIEAADFCPHCKMEDPGFEIEHELDAAEGMTLAHMGTLHLICMRCGAKVKHCFILESVYYEPPGED